MCIVYAKLGIFGDITRFRNPLWRFGTPCATKSASPPCLKWFIPPEEHPCGLQYVQKVWSAYMIELLYKNQYTLWGKPQKVILF